MSFSRWPHRIRILLVALLVFTLAAAAPLGGFAAIVAVFGGTIVVTLVSRRLLRAEDERLTMLAVGAFVARVGLIAVVDLALASSGRSRILAPDEGLYYNLASQIASYWHDVTLPFDHSDPFIPNHYVQSVARLFFFVGPNLLVLRIVNTLLEVLASLLVYRVAANLNFPRPRLALLLMLVFPSLVAWSALGLKDAYVLFFVMLAFWSMTEFIRTLDHRWHLLTAAAFMPIMTVRLYVFVVLVVAWLFIVIAAPARARLWTAAVVTPLAAILLMIANPIGSLGGLATNIPYVAIMIREQAAVGGRTSFVEPVPVFRCEPGDEVIVATAGDQQPPAGSPRVVLVPPGTELVLQLTPTAPPAPDRPFVVVRPGDMAICTAVGTRPTTLPEPVSRPTTPPEPVSPGPGTPGDTPPPVVGAPSTPRPSVTLSRGVRNIVGAQQKFEEESSSPTESALSNLRHIPVGLLFTLTAPFPWTATTLADFAAIPEMLLWYVCAGLAGVGLVLLAKRRNLSFLPGFMALAALTFVFALIQANVGTLIRSRAMLIPFVIVFACVGADWLWGKVGPWLSPRLPSLVKRVHL